MSPRGRRFCSVLALSMLAAVAAAAQTAVTPSSDPDLQLILPRLAKYVDAYQRQFSAIVAEEVYDQSSMGRRVRLRSDLLLLAPVAGRDWVQFRDVYEVDGQKVRDREDRLKKLFLENNAEGLRQMEAIREESARYNVGEVRRNQNVPVYPLAFATAENMPHFTFKVAGKGATDGLVTWRVEYVEQRRPTFIRNPQGEDVPVRGSFTVDLATGAVLATEMVAEDTRMRGRIVVRYRRDKAQDLWLPREMLESYEASVRPVSGKNMTPVLRAEARASYSNFRRFRVTTEEQVREKK